MTALGFVVRPEHPPEDLAAIGAGAEAAGFDELWLWEDCFFAGGIAATATALAATSRSGSASGSCPRRAQRGVRGDGDRRPRAVPPGRVLPGVGHGVGDWMRQIGAKPASQLGLLEETVVAIRSLLAGEEVHAEGRYVRLHGVRLDHPPARCRRSSPACGARARSRSRGASPTARS